MIKIVQNFQKNYKLMNISKLALLFAVCLTAFSCIDSDYDFTNVSGEAEIFGSSIALPVGTATLRMDSIIGKIGIDTTIFRLENGTYIFTEQGDVNTDNLSSSVNDFEIPPITSIKTSIPFFNATGLQVPYNLPVGATNLSGKIVVNLPDFDTNMMSVDSILLKNTIMRMVFNTENLLVNTDKTDAVITFTPADNNAEYFFNNKKETSWSINIGTPKEIEIRKIKIKGYSKTLTFNWTANVNVKSAGGLVATGAEQTYIEINTSFSGTAFKKVWGRVNYSLAGAVQELDFNAFGDLMSQNDVLTLYNPTIKVISTSNTGIPFNVALNVSANNSTTGSTSALTNTNFYLLPAENETILKTNTFLMNKDNGTANMFKINPDRIRMSYNISSDVNSASNHFITDNNQFDLKWKIEVPMQFGKGLSFNYVKTIDCPLDGLEKITDQDENMEVALTLDVKNRLPLNIVIKLTALDKDSTALFTTQSDVIAAAEVDAASGFAKSATTTSTQLKLTSEQVEMLRRTEKFGIGFTVTTGQTYNFVTVQPEDNIEIKIGAKITGGIRFDLNN